MLSGGLCVLANCIREGGGRELPGAPNEVCFLLSERQPSIFILLPLDSKAGLMIESTS